MKPPITPKVQNSSSPSGPSMVTAAGMMVWNGRLLGARQLGCSGSSMKFAPRFCSVKPQPSPTIPVPKPCEPLPHAHAESASLARRQKSRLE